MKRFIILLVLLAAMSTACSELQSYRFTGHAPVISGVHGVDYLLTELHHTRAMNKNQLQQTLDAWEQEFQADSSPDNRLKLALLYAAGKEPIRDPGRAQELLNEDAKTLSNPAARELAALVRQFLEERMEVNRRVNDLNKQIAEQGRRIAELEEQQRALMSIEQKMQQREVPVVIENDK